MRVYAYTLVSVQSSLACILCVELLDLYACVLVLKTSSGVYLYIFLVLHSGVYAAISASSSVNL